MWLWKKTAERRKVNTYWQEQAAERFLEIMKYAATQMAAERAEPKGAAAPMGKSVSGKNSAAKYAPGILTKIMEAQLCKKEINDLPKAQKYPLKEKCTAAKKQSNT